MLLVSTYELGHQPWHLAAPAAELVAAGVQVKLLDLAVDSYDTDLVDWAEAVAISVPMHTAMRLAVTLAERIRQQRPELPLAMYGLYAASGTDHLVDRAFVGEYQPDLVAWALDPTGTGLSINLGRHRFPVPTREALPDLERYAQLVSVSGEPVLVGYVEASHGCRHRCRHCPIPAVYDGIYRIVDPESVAADIDRQVAMGAGHITFGDPDFLNGPAHALRVLRAANTRHPRLTFDLTVKVEHLLSHAVLLPELAELGVIFVISAFESVDDTTLTLLDKGHTLADMEIVVGLCRRAGIDLHPSWMPFTPWTMVDDVVTLFSFLDRHDLLGFTDPVQLGIKLLVPEGSLMLEVVEMSRWLGDYRPEALGYCWEFADPRVGRLQTELAALAAAAADAGTDPVETLVGMWRHTLETAGQNGDRAQIPVSATTGRPRMTEPWFC